MSKRKSSHASSVCSVLVFSLLLAVGCENLTQTQDSRSVPDNQLAAAHILIMHEGSNRRPEHITRSREDALVLIEDIAQQVRAPDADFEALAKEYSDCPTGPDGGHLGAFQPNQMVKPFSDATKALELGAVSDPVETAFGYHIILREAP